jgi:hypothetical protein
MIIDFQNDPGKAACYSVFDAETGECLDRTFPVFYADDEAGIVRRYLRGENGRGYLRDPLTKQLITGAVFENQDKSGKKTYQLENGEESDREPEVAWEEIKRVIKIRPKPQEEPR